MENLEQNLPAESYFERSQRLEAEKREKIREEIKPDLGGGLESFIIKKYSLKQGQREIPELAEVKMQGLSIAERMKNNDLKADDLKKLGELIKSIGLYIGYHREKSRGDQAAMDEIIKFEVLKEELESYVNNFAA